MCWNLSVWVTALTSVVVQLLGLFQAKIKYDQLHVLDCLNILHQLCTYVAALWRFPYYLTTTLQSHVNNHDFYSEPFSLARAFFSVIRPKFNSSGILSFIGHFWKILNRKSHLFNIWNIWAGYWEYWVVFCLLPPPPTYFYISLFKVIHSNTALKNGELTAFCYMIQLANI